MLKTNTKLFWILFCAVWKHRQVTKICCWSLHKQFTSNDCIDDILFTSRKMNKNLTIKLSLKQCIVFWNRNWILTSDTDISSRWIPSKHFQVADIFNSEWLCLKKNGILQNSVMVEKKLCGIYVNWLKNFLTWKNFNFSKTLKCSAFFYISPFQKYPLYKLKSTHKFINTVGTKYFQTNTIYIYLHQRHGEMILTTFAVYNLH